MISFVSNSQFATVQLFTLIDQNVKFVGVDFHSQDITYRPVSKLWNYFEMATNLMVSFTNPPVRGVGPDIKYC